MLFIHIMKTLRGKGREEMEVLCQSLMQVHKSSLVLFKFCSIAANILVPRAFSLPLSREKALGTRMSC